jgi:hypothetical protein
MKISIDDKEVFKLSEMQKKVIKNDIPEEIFEADMHRRLRWVLLEEKYEKCFARLKAEWEPKLRANGFTMIPAEPDAFAELVFKQPNYKNRSQRERETQALLRET